MNAMPADLHDRLDSYWYIASILIALVVCSPLIAWVWLETRARKWGKR